MKTLKRSHSEAFLQKMKPVFIFREFYTKNPCYINEGILELSEPETKDFILSRVFIDLSRKSTPQPYIIFARWATGIVILDLISRPVTLEEIINYHDEASFGHSVFGSGTLFLKKDKVILNKDKKNDDLAAAILWSVNYESNLELDDNSFELVKEILNPGI